MSRRHDTIDRTAVAAFVRDHGVVEAVKRWPAIPGEIHAMARLYGLEKRRADAIWKPEWTELLGTKADGDLAVECGVSLPLVTHLRRRLGILRYGRSRMRAVADAKKLAKLSDNDLREPVDVIASVHGIRHAAVTRERLRRGIITMKGRPPRAPIPDSDIARAAVAGALVGLRGVTLAQVGKRLGVTRERTRQLAIEAKEALARAIRRSNGRVSLLDSAGKP